MIRALALVLLLPLLAAGCGNHRSTLAHLVTGDRATVPQAGVRCDASFEGGSKNLLCSSLNRRGPDVTFYADEVLVWLSPDNADSFPWTNHRAGPADSTGGMQRLVLRSGDRIESRSTATTCVAGDHDLRCTPDGGGRYTVVFEPARIVVLDRRGPVHRHVFPKG